MASPLEQAVAFHEDSLEINRSASVPASPRGARVFGLGGDGARVPLLESIARTSGAPCYSVSAGRAPSLLARAAAALVERRHASQELAVGVDCGPRSNAEASLAPAPQRRRIWWLSAAARARAPRPEGRRPGPDRRRRCRRRAPPRGTARSRPATAPPRTGRRRRRRRPPPTGDTTGHVPIQFIRQNAAGRRRAGPAAAPWRADGRDRPITDQLRRSLPDRWRRRWPAPRPEAGIQPAICGDLRRVPWPVDTPVRPGPGQVTVCSPLSPERARPLRLSFAFGARQRYRIKGGILCWARAAVSVSLSGRCVLEGEDGQPVWASSDGEAHGVGASTTASWALLDRMREPGVGGCPTATHALRQVAGRRTTNRCVAAADPVASALCRQQFGLLAGSQSGLSAAASGGRARSAVVSATLLRRPRTASLRRFRRPRRGGRRRRGRRRRRVRRRRRCTSRSGHMAVRRIVTLVRGNKRMRAVDDDGRPLPTVPQASRSRGRPHAGARAASRARAEKNPAPAPARQPGRYMADFRKYSQGQGGRAAVRSRPSPTPQCWRRSASTASPSSRTGLTRAALGIEFDVVNGKRRQEHARPGVGRARGLCDCRRSLNPTARPS